MNNNKRQMFAIMNCPRVEDGTFITNGDLVEIDLDNCGGLDGLIQMGSTELVPVIWHEIHDSVSKDWLCDFWIA